MTLRISKNKPHPNENNIASGWQRVNISEVGLKPNVQPQHVAGLDFWYRSVCYPDIW